MSSLRKTWCQTHLKVCRLVLDRKANAGTIGQCLEHLNASRGLPHILSHSRPISLRKSMLKLCICLQPVVSVQKEFEEEAGDEGASKLHHPTGGIRYHGNLGLQQGEGFIQSLSVPCFAFQEILCLLRRHSYGCHSTISKTWVPHNPSSIRFGEGNPHTCKSYSNRCRSIQSLSFDMVKAENSMNPIMYTQLYKWY